MSDSATIRLRPAVAADVPALVEVARRAWLSAFAQTAPVEIVRWWAMQDREPAWYARDWRAMTVAVPCGSADALSGLVQPAGDEINGLWVHPRAQGRGIGARLLAAAEAQIRAAGHARAWLTCSGFNGRARVFYEGRGYRLVATARHVHPAGVLEEVWTLARLLDGAGVDA